MCIGQLMEYAHLKPHLPVLNGEPGSETQYVLRRKALQLLREVLRERSSNSREACAKGLPGALHPMICHPDCDVRCAALGVLAQLTTDRGILPTLIQVQPSAKPWLPNPVPGRSCRVCYANYASSGSSERKFCNDSVLPTGQTMALEMCCKMP